MSISSKFKLAPIIIALLSLSTMSGATGSEKFRVRSIEFSGNRLYSSRQLQRMMLTRPSNLLAKRYFDPNLFEDDLDHLIKFYINDGFLDARIDDRSLTFDSLRQQVSIHITIHEGEQTTIAGISFFGNQIAADSVLHGQIKSVVGQPFRKSTLEDDTYRLLSFYADRGYIEAQVSPALKVNSEQHTILIDFNIDEGPQIRIGELVIDGLKKTRRRVLLRELDFQSGDIYHHSRILASQHNLYLTGLFTSVFIRPDDRSTTEAIVRNIRIEAEEKKNGELNFGFGYGTLDRWRGSIELLQNNVAGTARQIGLSAFVSTIARRLELSFSDPWLFNTRTKADINEFFERREEPGYSLRHYGTKFTLGRRLGMLSKLNLSYRYEIVHLSGEAIPDTLRSTRRGNTRSLTLSLVRDSRNDLVNTTRGAFSSLDVESAGAFLKGTATFVKISARHKYFYTLGERLVLASALTAGWMDKFGSSTDIPIQERFFTGGASSVRGFKEKFVGPLDQRRNPVGGNMLLVLNLMEVRYMFYKKFSAIAFLDVGNVWSGLHQVEKLDFRKGMGFGLRFNSPLGILRLDYGLKLDRRSGETPGEIYFSVGQAF
ncbi:MAG: outer membrane protein assembly factor BamA [candidate division KSB1 bacterium]|nr:outer membrane protein assembly factor BamA [candidate division KSB1 bacterium]MDZ7318059.1 outer membrane protein assembly factor BamA [candidate division KSB1 bacterium]MDZ7339752.1 outer membrane protein assembly factor BamA [candidate division KSB1 bacterium]